MRDHVGCMDREGRLDLMLELLCMHIGKYYSLYYEYVPRPDVGKPLNIVIVRAPNPLCPDYHGGEETSTKKHEGRQRRLQYE
jgi:hypothetical protein